ncbi:hypothetical protein GCM10022253_26060 [Sphingomonas endophytica]
MRASRSPGAIAVDSTIAAVAIRFLSMLLTWMLIQAVVGHQRRVYRGVAAGYNMGRARFIDGAALLPVPTAGPT